MEYALIALVVVTAAAVAFAVRADTRRRALATRLDLLEDRAERAADHAEQAARDTARARRLLDRLAWVTAVDARQPIVSVKDDLITFRRTRGEKLEIGERHILDAAIANAEHAVKLMDELAAWATATDDDVADERYDLRDALDKALIELDHDGKATVDVESLPEVRGDVDLMATALHAVLDNCVRYRWPGKPVHVRVSAEGRGTTVRLLVEDDGMGLRMEDPAWLFEPFARGDGAAAMPGTGLGLAVARRCVEAQGGRIEFAEHEGRGATIAITIPAG